MNKMLCKLSSEKGMTLTELLVTMLLLVMMTATVTLGTRAGMRVYRSSRFISESHLISETIDNALSDVLRFASNPIILDDEVVHFDQTGYGLYNENSGTLKVANGIFYLTTITDQSREATNNDAMRLLSIGSYANLWVVPGDTVLNGDALTLNEITYDETSERFYPLTWKNGVFSGCYKLYDPQYHHLSETFEFCYRPLNN